MDKKKDNTDNEETGSRAQGVQLDSIVEGQVSAPSVGEACLLERPVDPCTIVIIGASGDLTSRKLIPAFSSLFLKGGLPDPCVIVGCGRTDMTTEDFRSRIEEAVRGGGRDLSRWGEFITKVFYRTIDYESEASFIGLAGFLRDLDGRNGTGGNRIFYLALPMFLYGTTAELLGRTGLARENQDGNGWARIVVEKPYGSDRQSAAELDRTIHESFREDQVFRIDHYLAKETVQNLLVFRFANSIFEPLWNRHHIEHVDIMAVEKLGVEKRAGYYERSGVLRDMFQNHMMQLLALTAMDPPIRFEADPVQDEKVKVFQSLRPLPVGNLFENLVLGQYGPGTVDGRPVPGYLEEEGVASDSLTPTYGMMRLFIDNWRWQGVPFFLTSGKRLGAKLTQIVIKFRDVPVSMFRGVFGDHITANVLTLGIQPEEHITLTFQTKNPGAKVCLRSVTMDFNYLQGYSGPVLEAYEKALLDCMQGERMLFWRGDGIDRTWAFMDPVLKECETCPDRAGRLLTYEAGSSGPPAAAKLKRMMVNECL